MEKTNNRLDEISDAEKYNVNLYNCPYLNLVNAILKRELDDLTLDLITDTQPWRKKKKNSYLKLARAFCLAEKGFAPFGSESSG